MNIILQLPFNENNKQTIAFYCLVFYFRTEDKNYKQNDIHLDKINTQVYNTILAILTHYIKL